MSFFNRDPHECESIEELREWVLGMQNLLFAQRQVNEALKEQNKLLYSVFEVQDELNNELKEGRQLLKERIAQHESGAVHGHRFRQN